MQKKKVILCLQPQTTMHLVRNPNQPPQLNKRQTTYAQYLTSRTRLTLRLASTTSLPPRTSTARLRLRRLGSSTYSTSLTLRTTLLLRRRGSSTYSMTRGSLRRYAPPSAKLVVDERRYECVELRGMRTTPGGGCAEKRERWGGGSMMLLWWVGVGLVVRRHIVCWVWVYFWVRMRVVMVLVGLVGVGRRDDVLIRFFFRSLHDWI